MRSVSSLNRRARLPCLLAILLLSLEPVAGGELRSLTAGPQYEASSLHTWLLGEGWRRLWTLPIQVPALDLKQVGGGLQPVKKVGEFKTLLVYRKK